MEVIFEGNGAKKISGLKLVDDVLNITDSLKLESPMFFNVLIPLY